MPEAIRASGSWSNRPTGAASLTCSEGTLSRVELLSPSLSLLGLCLPSSFHLEDLSLAKVYYWPGLGRMPPPPSPGQAGSSRMGLAHYSLLPNHQPWLPYIPRDNSGTYPRGIPIPIFFVLALFLPLILCTHEGRAGVFLVSHSTSGGYSHLLLWVGTC